MSNFFLFSVTFLWQNYCPAAANLALNSTKCIEKGTLHLEKTGENPAPTILIFQHLSKVWKLILGVFFRIIHKVFGLF